MNKAPICKWDGYKLEKKGFIQPYEGGLCPPGTYEYYVCPLCGFRYSVTEVEYELQMGE